MEGEVLEEVVNTVASANDPASLLGIFFVPIIFGLVFACMAIYKHLVKDKNEMWTKLIPIWAGLLGITLTVYFFYKFPQLLIAEDVVSAMVLGLTIGLSTVGMHQVGKQFSKFNQNNETTATSSTIAAAAVVPQTTTQQFAEKKEVTNAPVATVNGTTMQVTPAPIQVTASYAKMD